MVTAPNYDVYGYGSPSWAAFNPSALMPANVPPATPVAPAPAAPLGNTGLGLSATTSGFQGDLNSLSDSQLMDLAQQYGIDTSWMGANNITLDPAVQQAVSQVYGSQRELGNQDLMRSAIEAAGARGLNLSDTPIADPYLRNKALMESQLRGNEAASLLGLSQNRYAQNQAQNQFQTEQSRLNQVQNQNFLTNLYSFQQNLAQSAAQNRLQLANQAAQLGLGLSNARLSQPGNTSTTSGTSGFNPQQFGTGISAIGAGLQGLSGLDLGSLFSTSPYSLWNGPLLTAP